MADEIELTIERAVAGGRMLARSDRGVVLVAGAIPGERVRAAVERRTRQVSWATVTEVLEPSADRRPVPCDPTCGGLHFAHIEAGRQRALKGEIIVDALRRIGRFEAAGAIPVEASPERGYRLRARLHVQGGKVGFFREQTHELCDAAATGQLRNETPGLVARTIERLGPAGRTCGSVVVAENVAATERVLHLEPGRHADFELPDAVRLEPGLSGVTAWADGGVRVLAGQSRVCDTAADLFGGNPPAGIPAGALWARSAASFFQGNRFLLGALVRHVIGHLQGRRMGDAYAGVGLFAVAAAARGDQVLAIEGDRNSAADLLANAAAWPGLTAEHGPVERLLRRIRAGVVETLVLDPPRSGLSPEAADAVLALRVRRIVYVSCDVATLARDAARLRDAGYTLGGVHGFDLFPNTGHVETVAVLDRA